jgi:hypothetical protein
VLLNEANDQLSVGSYSADGLNLILTHEAAVTFHIGTEDSAELTFDALCGHESPLEALKLKE